MDEAARDMQAEAQQPKDEQDYEYCPEHRISFLEEPPGKTVPFRGVHFTIEAMNELLSHRLLFCLMNGMQE